MPQTHLILERAQLTPTDKGAASNRPGRNVYLPSLLSRWRPGWRVQGTGRPGQLSLCRSPLMARVSQIARPQLACQPRRERESRFAPRMLTVGADAASTSVRRYGGDVRISDAARNGLADR
jgi:hypothetical protein